MSGSEAISPTAHYTGYVWARNGLSHRELATVEGRVLYESLRPMMTLSGLLGRGIIRFDLRKPGQMTVKLPNVPKAAEPTPAQDG